MQDMVGIDGLDFRQIVRAGGANVHGAPCLPGAADDRKCGATDARKGRVSVLQNQLLRDNLPGRPAYDAFGRSDAKARGGGPRNSVLDIGVHHTLG